ncbi:hypothetical protein MesoLj113b_65920 [Mesorhizobium sp. 113-3-3]|nr:hypothetical protein MesoLj113b_65920 [Mesorhizobium sp. 113-3-3]BCG90928.1 hypothetical protein MesoLj113c_70380 [Mesorhizobium sp. 113-3-9]
MASQAGVAFPSRIIWSHLQVMERDVARSALADEGVKRLMTIPGGAAKPLSHATESGATGNRVESESGESVSTIGEITTATELTSLGVDSLGLADLLWDVEQAYDIKIDMTRLTPGRISRMSATWWKPSAVCSRRRSDWTGESSLLG